MANRLGVYSLGKMEFQKIVLTGSPKYLERRFPRLQLRPFEYSQECVALSPASADNSGADNAGVGWIAFADSPDQESPQRRKPDNTILYHSPVVTTDSVRHRLQCNNNPDCQLIQARPIKLRFHLNKAKLYSFTLRIRHTHYVPSYG